MKRIQYLRMLLVTLPLTACYIGPGGICGPQTPIAYCQSKEELDKLLHPKTYGEYFVKPGMTKEGWRQDWVACGGRANGAYSVGERQPEDTDDFATSRRKGERLDACMHSKGYEFRREPF